MTASNDDVNSENESERRERFRIDDIAILEVAEVDIAQSIDKPAEYFFKPSPLFSLIREMRAIDADNISVLRALGEQSNELAIYLAAINKKIDIIAKASAEAILGEDQKLQSIDLSEGGIGFVQNTKLNEDGFYALKIWFHRALIGISVYIRVVACSPTIDGGYHISASFHAIPEADVQVIARHIMQVQSEQQRLKKDKTDRPHG